MPLGSAQVGPDGTAGVPVQSDLLAVPGVVVQASYSGDAFFTAAAAADNGQIGQAVAADPPVTNPNIPANAQNLTVVIVCGSTGAQRAQWRDSARRYYGAGAYIITNVHTVEGLGAELSQLPAGSVSRLVIGAHGWGGVVRLDPANNLNTIDRADNAAAAARVRAALANNALVDLQYCGAAATWSGVSGLDRMQAIATVLRARVRGAWDIINTWNDPDVLWAVVDPS